MAIRDVVTRGFGNGTYDPAVYDLPVKGYTAVGDPPSVPGVEMSVSGDRLHYAVPEES